MTQAVTPQQMRQLEQQADRLGVSYQQMMQNAGTGIAQGVFQDMLTQEERRLVALCGKGNNGGDGFVAAGLLADMGVRVQVILTQGLPSREPAAWAYREYVQSRDIPVISLAQQPQQALEALAQTHGVLDAIFGTGFSGRLPEDLLPLLSAVKPYQRVYAADLPSGCDAATGQASPGTLKACRTFSLGFYKLGQFLDPCKGLCGSVSRVPIGMPKECVPIPRSMLVEQEDLVHFLRDLPPDAHKGSQGRLVCVTGCRQYPGACYLSAAAAARTGVGIVTVASTRETLDAVFPLIPEATRLPLEADGEGFAAQGNLPRLEPVLERCQGLLVGCGLGTAPGSRELVAGLLEKAPQPLVLDADGLNIAAALPEGEKRRGQKPLVLTPHPGEAARLLGRPVEEALADRPGAALTLARRWNAVVVLKGHQTLAAEPEGRFALLHNGANPGLAKGGSGDLLAGFIAGFLTQGYPLFEGTVAGVLLHSVCGRLAEEIYSHRAMLPSQLLEFTGKAFAQCHQWL